VRVHSLTLSYTPRVCDVNLGLPLGLHLYNPFALVTSPKLGLRQLHTQKKLVACVNYGIRNDVHDFQNKHVEKTK